MFTGLIRDVGTITQLTRAGDLQLEITPGDTAFPLALGASIACNGICLTVTSIGENNAFTVALSAETLACTTAGNWAVGQRLNLEPSLCVGDALGGHFVSGHVDGIATVISATPSGDSTVWEFAAPTELMKFIARKGSVAMDGVSLTVNTVTHEIFSVNIIAHTAAHTTFGHMNPGDRVNIEIDLLARYAARIQEFSA
jgi:riboflavin synthase